MGKNCVFINQQKETLKKHKRKSYVYTYDLLLFGFSYEAKPTLCTLFVVNTQKVRLNST